MDYAMVEDGIMGFGMGGFGMLLVVALTVLAAVALVKYITK